MPPIGAHVSGGIKGGVARAREIGAECVQVFLGSPQTWRAPTLAAADVEAFRDEISAAGLASVYVHAIYLINLAAEKPDIYEKSVASMTAQVSGAARIGADGIIFHPGSAGSASYEDALARLAAGLETVLARAEGGAPILLEVCAGQGRTLGCTFRQIADMIDAVGNHPRLGVCWDTCHLFAAGYDISTAEGLERTLDEMDSVLGLSRLAAIHANDSKFPLGSGRDRHENIGHGHIGEAAFERLLTHPSLAGVPFLLEVPGFDGNGPDAENVATLRRLAGAAVSEALSSSPCSYTPRAAKTSPATRAAFTPVGQPP